MADYFESVAMSAIRWVGEKAYRSGKGLFLDGYNPATREVMAILGADEGRPLADDAVFLKAYTRSGDEFFLNIFREVIEILVKNEKPKGNWICWGPANEEKGNIHPRHAYWWGRPFIAAYKKFRDTRYLGIAIRSAKWYLQALRTDGGLFRNTYVDFNTDSFGHATSGTACAVILFNELRTLLLDDNQASKDANQLKFGTTVEELVQSLENGIRLGLDFCYKMQLTMPDDEEMYGVIIEKIHPPRGSDQNPLHIRDLGTIFYIQACHDVITRTIKDRT